MAGGPLTAVLQYIGQLAGRPDSGDLTDGQLLERFVGRRDEAAFGLLVKRYGPLVLGLCRRLLRHEQDAEDVFQATFLLLVRKAGTIAKRESVGSWLYGVAFRMAGQVRARAAARRTRPGAPADVAVTDATPEFVWAELRPVLDEEVGRLPHKYREAFLLCCLEGKTHAEAARQLGCPRGTVVSRVARARQRLRSRLARRGLALSAGALAAALSSQALTAAVPPTLLSSTLQAARSVAAGAASLGGAASARVAALTEGMCRAMFLAKVRVAAVVVLAVAALGLGAGVAARQVLAKPPAGADQVRDPVNAPGGEKPREPNKAAPPEGPLVLRVTAKKDTYPLDLGGKTAEEFRKLLKDTEKTGTPPPKPAVDLTVELRNTGDQEITIDVIGEEKNHLRLDLKGPGAVQRLTPVGGAPSGVRNKSLTVGAGKSLTFPLARLEYGEQRHGWYWTQAGEYTLTATFSARITVGGKDRNVTLTSTPVKLKVVDGPAGKEQAKSDPPGVPLEARIVVKKDTYTLDLGGKTEEEFRKERLQKEKTTDYPPAPEVDLVLELHNTGTKELKVWMTEDFKDEKPRAGGDHVQLALDLKGPGATKVVVNGRQKAPATPGPKAVTVAPGKVVTLPITSLSFGQLGIAAYRVERAYWTRAGEYTLAATLKTAVDPAPEGAKNAGGTFGFVSLTSAPVKLKVVNAGKDKE